MKTIPLILLLAHGISAASSPASPDRVPDGLQGSDWHSIHAAHEAWKHRFEIQSDGKTIAQHPAMGWSMRFDDTGFTVHPREDSWKWGLELALPSGATKSASPRLAREHPGGNSVHRSGEPPLLLSYRRTAEITEWFINDSRGLEQGWTLSAPADIRLRVRGNLPTQVSPQSISFGGNITYSGLKAWDATGKTVSTWFETAPEGFHVRYDDRSATYPITIDPLAQQAYLKAFNTGSGDKFGTSVAVSGDTVVVGAPFEDSSTTGINSTPNNSSADSGAAYVFVWNGSTWTQQAYLKASNTGAGDEFGQSVAVTGDTVVVGAYREDSGSTGINSTANEGASDSGAAYVFVRSGSTWTQQAYLKASNTGVDDVFGYTVAASGETVVVGAVRESSSTSGVNSTPNESAAFSGAAYVFTRSGVTWSQQAYLKASNTGAGDNFGNSVAVSADTVVVGAPAEASSTTGVNSTPNNSASFSGAAYVFVRSGVTWTQQAYLKASNTGATDQFGVSVAVSADTVVVGANWEDSGTSGVNTTPNEAASSSGAAYVFVRGGVTWTQQAYLKSSNTGAGDEFGNSVAVSGDALIIGAPLEDSSTIGVGSTPNESASGSGAAYLFTRASGVWTQQSYLKASNTGTSDQFGVSAAVSGDSAIVGAFQEDSSTTGVNSTPNTSASASGSAYIFTGFSGTPPSINNHPTATTIASGGTTTLSVTASGTAPFTYQWYQGTSGTTTTPVGTNSSSFTTPPLTSTTSYWVRVSNAASSVNSTVATITVGFVNQSEMILIPAGSFTMGRTSGDTDTNAPPVTVTISEFHMAKYEVATSLWETVRLWGLANGYTDLTSGAGKAGNHPVHSITWFQAVKWCNARSEMEGLAPVYSNGGNVMRSGTTAPSVNWNANGYRLPTEAEWEKAARGGVGGQRFPLGNTISHSHANFSNNGGEPFATGTTGHHPAYISGSLPYTSPVGSFAANGYGLHDMAGNVGEWCWDWDITSYVNGAVDPRGPSSGVWRAVRDGAWNTSATACRSSQRGANPPGDSYINGGFRVARSSVAVTAPEITAQPVSTSIAAGGTATLSVLANGTGPLTYQWYEGTAPFGSPVGTNSNEFTTPNLFADASFWVLVSNPGGDTPSQTATVFVSSPVSFPDPALEAAIRAALGIPSNPITEADMQSLTSLNLRNLGITNLSGLETATNLRILDLRNNAFTDTAALWAVLDQLSLYCLYLNDARPGGNPPELLTQNFTDTSGTPFLATVNPANLPTLSLASLDINLSVPSNQDSLQAIAASGIVIDNGGANLAPFARASANVLSYPDGTVSLDGSASDDIDGTVASWAWSWPGGSSAAANPTIILPLGETTVTLTVTDDDGEASTTSLSVRIFTLGNAIQTAGLTGNDALPNAIPFGDGVPNLLKFAFNMNLAGPDSRTLSEGGNSGLPTHRVVSAGAASVFRYEYIRHVNAGLLYTPRKKSDLGTGPWQTLTSAPVITVINDDWVSVVHEEPFDPASTPKCFFSVEVELGQ